MIPDEALFPSGPGAGASRPSASRHASWTVDALVERRAELTRIALSVRRRLLGALSV
ncbi:MAG: hypothetical protein Q8T11_04590 [Elusimicrobiota bacterium]|nr:hypothetical protein [Elusimicrobiota bacterium]